MKGVYRRRRGGRRRPLHAHGPHLNHSAKTSSSIKGCFCQKTDCFFSRISKAWHHPLFSSILISRSRLIIQTRMICLSLETLMTNILGSVYGLMRSARTALHTFKCGCECIVTIVSRSSRNFTREVISRVVVRTSTTRTPMPTPRKTTTQPEVNILSPLMVYRQMLLQHFRNS